MLRPFDAAFAGTIIHIGAGDFLDFPGYLDAAQNVVLIEPDAARLKSLKLDTDHPKLSVVEMALSDHEGEADLTVFNLPGLSSLFQPTGLKELYPGLKVTRRVAAPALSVQAFLDLLKDKPKPYALVLETTGGESWLVDALQGKGALDWFTRIDIRTGTEPLFEGSKPLAAMIKQLEEAGFAVAAQDTNDEDWPIASLDLDTKALAIKGLQQELTAGKQRESALQARLTTLESEHKTMSETAQQGASRIKELEAALATAKQDADKRSAELTSKLTALGTDHQALTEKADWRHKRIKELEGALETAKQTADKRSAELTSKLTTLGTDHQALTEKADWRLKRIKELEGALETAKQDADKRAADLTGKLTTLEAAHKGQTEKTQQGATRIKELEGALASAKQDSDKRAADLTGKLTTLEAAHKGQTEKTQQGATRIKELEGALASAKQDADKRAADLTGKLTTLETDHQTLTEKADWRHKRIKELEGALAKAKQTADERMTDMSVGVRVQSLLQNDLRDLQVRYQEVLQIKTRQQALLDALKPRLQEAARYLQTQQMETAIPVADAEHLPMVEKAKKRKKTKKSSAKPSARKKK